MIDIDEFKQINDKHGHHAGDLALRQIASVITQRLRDTDVIARFGGDEFAALLPYAGEIQAVAVGKDLQHVIGTSQLDLDNGTSIKFSASVGVALIDKDTGSEDAVLAVADRAMYKDKARNRPS